MLAVRTVLARDGAGRPPILLVHGAANSAGVWRCWQRELAARGWSSHALDLRGHGESEAIDLSRTTMMEYAADVVAAAGQLPRAPVLMGWSMGGLIAIMATARCASPACIGLAPSVPASRRDLTVTLRAGTFGSEEYGITSRDVDDQPAMPDLDREERALALASLGLESRMARDDRAAGIVVGSLPCPWLVVTGSADRLWPRERYRDLTGLAELVDVPGASHWGLVLNRRALAALVPTVIGWLARVTGGRPADG